jgi:hypothetical protein
VIFKRFFFKKSKAARSAPPVRGRYAFAIKEIDDDGAVSGVTRYPGGLLAAASRLSVPAGIDEKSGNVIYEENGIPYINSDLAQKSNHGTLDNNFKRLVESVTNAACSVTEEQALEGS